MNAAVRPIHLPTAKALDTLRRSAQAALEAWARQWVRGWIDGAQRALTLRICTVSDDPAPTGREYHEVRTPTGRMWFRDCAADRSSLGRAVAGRESMAGGLGTDDWIAGVVEAAWHSRNRELCSALIGTPEGGAIACAAELPASLVAFGSGALRVACDELGLHAITDSTVWRDASQRVSARRLPPLTPIERAAHRSRARLEVRLSGVDLELPKVADLRCGDVLRLPLRLDQALAVLCEGKQLARAVLGESRGYRSVRVTRDER